MTPPTVTHPQRLTTLDVSATCGGVLALDLFAPMALDQHRTATANVGEAAIADLARLVLYITSAWTTAPTMLNGIWPERFDVGDPAPQFVPEAWFHELNSRQPQDSAPFAIAWDDE